ncbi:MAG TPA: 3-oxoacyl-ACP reductase FabG [Victivallales bacterium]|nr:3-oxoacyl-ACP reductase FabG [Victivallales bacterium]
MSSKLALVVGGSRGIGRAIALRLSESGFNILLTYKSNKTAALQVKAKIEESDRVCKILGFDVSDYNSVKTILGKAVEEQTPDVVIFNSGITKDNLFAFMKKDEWNSVIRTNLDGFYNVINCVLFDMLAAKKGHIIAISSISGEYGHPGQVNYAASKAGLIGAVKSLAKEVGKKNILANVVSPGIIETDMTSDIPKEKVLPMIPLKRCGTPEDVAAVVNFLCCEENMYIHGQVIGVNGGLGI